MSSESNKIPGSAGHQTGKSSLHKGWYTRGYLPHYDEGEIHQLITYRLGDSLPQDILENMQFELQNVAPEFMEIKRREKIEKYLDMGHGSCILKNKEYANIIERTWQHFDKERYNLKAYVVMPNHVHILIKVYNGFELNKIVKSWKSYSSCQINKLMSKDAGLMTGAPRKNTSGLWQRGYWDRYIRDEEHFCKTIEYIKKNFDNGGILNSIK